MQIASPARESARLFEQRTRIQLALFLTPAMLWLILFFILPLGVILVYSFLSKGDRTLIEPTFTLGNYIRLLNADYFIIFRRSLFLALETTIACLLIGYPLAYVIARQPPRRRSLFLMLVIVPFWTNFLVRTYAWLVILYDYGILNTFLMGIGLTAEPLDMSYTPGAVLIGMIYGYLPFMVLPLYATLEKFDYTLIEAAHDSGAGDWRAFLRVMLPLTMPGIIAGCILVFIPAIGTFIISDILGGQKTMLIGNLINDQFGGVARNWPLASAISITLMVIVAAGAAVYYRYTGEVGRS